MASDEQLAQRGEEAIEALTGFINTSSLLDLAYRFSATYSELARTSTEHFLVTPVTALPTGREKGKFLSIDVGGTNLRVGFVELLGDMDDHVDSEENGDNVFKKVKRSHDRNWPIGDHLKMDKAEDLFGWIGGCIADVVREAITTDSSLGDEILLGITFSFPMAQTRLSEATLLPMGKGFAITTDLNLGKMLLAGYEQHRTSITSNMPLPRIRVAAITNDTVATFASLAYAVKASPNSRVAMGLIVGTGTNATVPMPLDKLHPSKVAAISNSDTVKTVVINTEWTIRGTDKPVIDLNIKTPWDLTLDANSDAPGFQPFEYMTSGRYLGEIVRLVFLDIISAEDLTSTPLSLQSRNALPTRFLSKIMVAERNGLSEELECTYPTNGSGPPFWTSSRIEQFIRITHAVQQRSSALIAAACIGLLHCVHDIHIDIPSDTTGTKVTNGTHSSHAAQEELVIAYAGGTISQYPSWLADCQHWINVLLLEGSKRNKSKTVVLKEALDGGIIGAGVLAGMTDEIA